MFFEINKYKPEELKTFWQNFANTTNHYTSNERWSEIVSKSDEYSDYLSLTYDNILYQGHNNIFNEEDMKTTVPFMFTGISVVLAKKVIFDYGVQQVIPYYEFETYFQTTRLTSIFERTREFSELKDDYKKTEEMLLTAFPDEEVTLWHILTTTELSDKLAALFDEKDFGFQLIELFTNILAFDFVRNYLKLSNERRDFNTVPEIEEDLDVSVNDSCYTETVYGGITTSREGCCCDNGC